MNLTMKPISTSLLFFVFIGITLMIQKSVHADPSTDQQTVTTHEALGSAGTETKGESELSRERGSSSIAQIADQTSNASHENMPLEIKQDSLDAHVTAVATDRSTTPLTTPETEGVHDKERNAAEMEQALPNESQSDARTLVQPVARNRGKVEANVNLDKQEMRVYLDGQPLYTWKVSTGIGGLPTPSGRYTPVWISRMHYSDEYEDAPMPYAVFFKKGYATHATQAVSLLGSPASHGCVRLSLDNAKIFFDLVKENGKPNTTINIVGLGSYDNLADNLINHNNRNNSLTRPSYPIDQTRTTSSHNSWGPVFVP
jgi:lipoprotein-anchoring transpeptidase ErfK/SrfK